MSAQVVMVFCKAQCINRECSREYSLVIMSMLGRNVGPPRENDRPNRKKRVSLIQNLKLIDRGPKFIFKIIYFLRRIRYGNILTYEHT